MRLLLHVGTHKTGTTSIQEVLARNRGWFAAQGVFYPGDQFLPSRTRTPHHVFAHGLYGDDAGAEAVSVAYALAVAEAAASMSDGLTVMSAEPLYGATRLEGLAGDATLTEAEYWPRRRSYLARLADVLAPFDVDVVIVLRRQDEFLEKLRLTEIERTLDPSRDRLILEPRPVHDYHAQIELLRLFFRSVQVLSYHRLMATGDLVGAFLGAAGLPRPATPHNFWTRVTPDARLLAWAAEMRAKGHGGGLLRTFLRSPKARALVPGRGTIWPDEAVRSAFLAAFAEDNARFEREHATPGAPPFFPPLEPLPTGGVSVTAAEASRLRAAFRDFRAKPPAPRTERWIDERPSRHDS